MKSNELLMKYSCKFQKQKRVLSKCIVQKSATYFALF
jgi:hypothetical protein